MMLKSILVAGLLPVLSLGQRSQSLYGQCGGQNWSGPVACPTGAYCKNDGNIWYSQCVSAASDSKDVPGGGGGGGVPQSSVLTRTLTTIFSIGGATPTIVTTRITYLTTRPTITAAPSPTITLVPDEPYEEDVNR